MIALGASADLVIFLVSIVAGLLGALGGVGGGLVIVPVLTLFFGVDIHVAAGASIVAVIATSSGAAVAFLRDGWANVQVGMFLQVATVAGAMVGALIAPNVPTQILLLTLGVVLLISVVMQVARLAEEPEQTPSSAPDTFRLSGSFYSLRLARTLQYRPQRVGAGFAMMAVAGVIWACWASARGP